MKMEEGYKIKTCYRVRINHVKQGLMIHACSPATWEAEAGAP
jgi:hypothetical protein